MTQHIHPRLKAYYAAAAAAPKRIVLPEALDPRTLLAASAAAARGLAQPLLIGESDAVRAAAREHNVALGEVEILDHLHSPLFEAYCAEYLRLRTEQGKQVGAAAARKLLANPLHFAAALVRMNGADGMVAGAVNTTSNVIRAAMFMLNPRSKASSDSSIPSRPSPASTPSTLQHPRGETETISSAFLMLHPDENFGERGAMIFADAGVIPEPSLEQIVDVAQQAAETCRELLDAEPRVALLSFSTKGSAAHPSAVKMRAAAQILAEKFPALKVDGELQFDAAVLPEICRRKSPHSPVAGRANTFIFPDLNSGNIAYKVAERLGGALALGPLLQGFSRPISDLSRGASAEDILNVMVVTSLRK